MKTLAILMVLISAVTTLSALEDSLQNREIEFERYIKACPVEELLRQMTEEIAISLPVENQQAFKDAIIQEFDLEVLTKATRSSMIKHFTADELKALADFTETSAGKSVIEKMRNYTEEITPKIWVEVEKIFHRFQENQITRKGDSSSKQTTLPTGATDAIDNKVRRATALCQQYLAENKKPDMALLEALNTEDVQVLDYSGVYIVSKGRERDGERIINAKGYEGNYFVKDMIKSSKALSPFEIGTQRYLWKNHYESCPREKIIRFSGIPEWEMVIFCSAYIEELGQEN